MDSDTEVTPERILAVATGFMAANLMAGEWLTASGEADCYSAEEITEWLRHTGWTVDRHQPVSGPSSLVVAHARM